MNTIKAYLQLGLDNLSRTLFGRPLISTLAEYPNIGLGGAFKEKAGQYLKDMGYTAVVSLRSKTPPKGIPTLHLPTTDWYPISIENLRRGVAFMEQIINEGGKVYVHCRQGIGRGPSMVIAYLISRGHSMEEALSMVKSSRAFIRPNRQQREQLRRFEKEYSAA